MWVSSRWRRLIRPIALTLLVLVTRNGFQAAAATTPWMQCDSSGKSESIGINVGNLSFQALLTDNVISALSQSGAGWIRINIFWARVQSARGQYDWTEVDQGLARLRVAHLKALITISGPVPCWDLSDPHGCSWGNWVAPPTNDWKTFVTAVVSRYKNQVQYWELWNEPDLIYSNHTSDPVQRLIDYRDKILIPGAQAVHRADPSAKVVGPVFAAIPSGNTAPGPQLEKSFALVMKGSGASLVDVVSFHAYFPGNLNEEAIAMHDAMSAVGMGGKHIWITEAGMAPEMLGKVASRFNAEPAEQAQADFLTQQVSTVLSHGNAEKVFWFALTDSTNFRGEHTNHYGLIDNADYKTYTWRPRSAFNNLKNFVRSQCGQ